MRKIFSLLVLSLFCLLSVLPMSKSYAAVETFRLNENITIVTDNHNHYLRHNDQDMVKINYHDNNYITLALLPNADPEVLWTNFKGSTDSGVNAAYAAHYISQLGTKDAYSYWYRLTDFYSSETEDPVITCMYDIIDDPQKPVPMLLGWINITNKVSVYSDFFPAHNGFGAIKGTEVRFRAEPNTNCQVLGYFEQGELISLLGFCQSVQGFDKPWDWARVQRENGQEGYVSAQFVQGKKPKPNY
ncbi:MAG: SH3 domain-containing protein [Phascolarctobacterium sp.]|nr:SH3 domain-containing protein [Phascolarctobacterium sp.]